MKKLILLSIIIVFSGILKAQTFPYLNASTGNEGQYIVDADTNIFMYHDNQLEKYDKNFNPIWVKKYSGIKFHSLLLSKTGSIYFICADTINYITNIVGKMNSDGSLNWSRKYVKSNTASLKSFTRFILDRNNNLVLSGNPFGPVWFLTLDTIGNVVNSKKFSFGNMDFGNCHIMEDSMGVYRFIGEYPFIGGTYIMHFKYDENIDLINSIKEGEGTGNVLGVNTKFFKSKQNQSVYYSFQEITAVGYSKYGFIVKYFKDSVVSKIYYNISFGPYFMNSFDEDQYGNIIYTISNYYTYNVAYEHYVTKINSSFSSAVFANYFTGSVFPGTNMSPIHGKIHALYGNKYFFDLNGAIFSSNPLLLTQLDSSLTTSCKTSTLSTFSPLPTLNLVPDLNMTYQIINDTTTYTNITPTVTAVNNFSLTTDYCLHTSFQEIKKETEKIFIHPNPANNVLNILSSHDLIEVTVFDITGKIIILQNHRTTINISNLNSGMYFIKIKTDQGEFTQKFIKE